MSTKTTIKRIALVAVSALGLGVLTSVAPASATATISSVTAGTVPASRVGATVTIPVTVTLSAHTASETITVSAKVIGSPSTSSLGSIGLGPDATNYVNSTSYPWFFLGDSDGTSDTDYVAGVNALAPVASHSYIGRFVSGTTTAGNLAASSGSSGVAAAAQVKATSSSANTTTSLTYYLTVKPDVAGTYTVLVSADSGVTGHASYVAGDVSSTFSFTTAGAPASATLTAVGGSDATNGTGAKGALYKLSFKDSAGIATTLSGDEAFVVTANAGNVAKATLSSGVFTSVSPSSSTTARFGAADLYNGVGFLNAQYAAAGGTVILTGSGSGALASTITATATYTTAAGLDASTTAAQTTTFAGRGGTAVTSGWYVPSAGTNYVPTTTTSNTIELTYTGETTANYGYLTVTDTNGLISGI